MRISITSLVFSGLLVAGAHAQTAYPVAGLTPDRRPEGAPVVKEFRKDQKWFENFYRGIDKPYPPHIDETSQGGWHTPFNRPGMTAPYDLRRWRQSFDPPKARSKGRRA